ncbi:hypothetical protein [Haladaptatus salinisoli]|uniref:hypothetical protein n=1 Tax=Haladaptatus salinisoli TaxID=2884876 RepID=UPI001D0B8637|nr:hypothetical protein [Haladaptatus salinisoli]
MLIGTAVEVLTMTDDNSDEDEDVEDPAEKADFLDGFGMLADEGEGLKAAVHASRGPSLDITGGDLTIERVDFDRIVIYCTIDDRRYEWLFRRVAEGAVRFETFRVVVGSDSTSTASRVLPVAVAATLTLDGWELRE